MLFLLVLLMLSGCTFTINGNYDPQSQSNSSQSASDVSSSDVSSTVTENEDDTFTTPLTD
ncbi:MAG: hypothetical protein ACI4II_01805 [Acutalibacteraceae bacterium]